MRRLHTKGALLTGVQTCALPIFHRRDIFAVADLRAAADALLELDVDDAGDGVGAILRRGAVAQHLDPLDRDRRNRVHVDARRAAARSEEHTSELQSLMRISYAVFCLKTKTKHQQQ